MEIAFHQPKYSCSNSEGNNVIKTYTFFKIVTFFIRYTLTTIFYT